MVIVITRKPGQGGNTWSGQALKPLVALSFGSCVSFGELFNLTLTFLLVKYGSHSNCFLF